MFLAVSSVYGTRMGSGQMYGSGTVAGPILAGAGRARESCLRERAGAGWHNTMQHSICYALYGASMCV